ncbi:MAG TPA: flavin reductase family protein [Acidimicrobiales bacterium]|nr:flavin reductase family protein [Acidimicrobiales bacterium]
MTPPHPIAGDPNAGDPDADRGAYDRLRRRVLWAMPTGLYLIGSRADQPDGTVRRNLMTANLVVQVATRPKLVAVAVDGTAVTCDLVDAGGCFAVSILRRDDRAVVRRFVKPVDQVEVDGAGRAVALAGHPVVEEATGAPILAAAAGWLDCEVRHRLPLGSHHLFVGEVVAAGGPDGDLPEVLRMEDTRMSYGG